MKHTHYLQGLLLAICLSTSLSGQQLFLDLNGIGDGGVISSSFPIEFFPLDSQRFVFFAGDGVSQGAPLWISDGTPENTNRLPIIGENDVQLLTGGRFTHLNDKLIFEGDNSRVSSEPHVTDGTPEGTKLLLDIATRRNNSFPDPFIRLGDSLFFPAGNFDIGRELYVTDGTPEGPSLFRDFNVGEGSAFQVRRTEEIAAAGGLLYMGLDDGVHGRELWRSDGTQDGTYLVKDINPGEGDSGPEYFLEYQGLVYFGAFEPGAGAQLWVTDPATDSTYLAVRNNEFMGRFGKPRDLIIFNDTLYYAALSQDFGEALIKSDGTQEGSSVLRLDFNNNPTAAKPSNFQIMGDQLIFQADHRDHGRELWRTDGTEQGSYLLKDINLTRSGRGDGIPFDATAGSTRYLVVGDSILFFPGHDDEMLSDDNGWEMYRTDGTPEGTYLVKDINPGPASANPDDLYLHTNGLIYFAADDGSPAGREMWVLDPDSTTLATSIFPVARVNNELITKVFPNPSSGVIAVEYQLEAAADLHFSVTDAWGKVVDQSKKQSGLPGIHTLRYDGAHLAPGTYFIRLWVGGQFAVRRFILN